MSCPTCGSEPPASSTFCNACGAKLVLTCASCGATPPPGSRFCNGCGASLDAAPASAPPARDPGVYTPKHLADKILQSKAALEGERKQVTVLFADVKGSMELAEQTGPEAWHAILDRFFQVLADGVHRFEGTVNQYTGDGIMALFGAPIAHEDHAERACYAALHIRTVVREYAKEVRAQHGVPFGASASTRARWWSARSGTICAWTARRNENTNGLLRQYFPKGTDLSKHRDDDLAAVAAALNSRPRKTLDWKTPAEALDQLLRSG